MNDIEKMFTDPKYLRQQAKEVDEARIRLRVLEFKKLRLLEELWGIERQINEQNKIIIVNGGRTSCGVEDEIKRNKILKKAGYKWVVNFK